MPTDLAGHSPEAWYDTVLGFIRLHQAWAPVIFGAMAFGESLVVIGVLIPATTVMVACGPLVVAGVLPVWGIFLGGVIGATLGDTVSFWLGQWLGPRAETMWPFRQRPELLETAERMFARWGWVAVFVGRFIGPLRASLPLAAGILGMRQGLFQLVNVVSAIAWIPVLLAPGAAIGWILQLIDGGQLGEAVEVGLAALAVLILGWVALARIARTLQAR